MKRRLICSNVHYFYYDTDFFFRKISEAGYRHVEFYLGTPHIFVDGNVIDDFSRAAECAKCCGCELSAVHPETLSFRYGLCHTDPDWNAQSVAAYRHCIDWAGQMGIRRLNTNVTGAFRDVSREETFDRIIRSLREICRYGAEKGVCIGLEAEAEHFEGFLTSLLDVKTMAGELSEYDLRVNLNWDAMEQAGETPADWLREFGEKCGMIRFSSLEAFEKAAGELEDLHFEGDVCFFLTDDRYLDRPYEEDGRIFAEVSKRWRDVPWD